MQGTTNVADAGAAVQAIRSAFFSRVVSVLVKQARGVAQASETAYSVEVEMRDAAGALWGKWRSKPSRKAAWDETFRAEDTVESVAARGALCLVLTLTSTAASGPAVPLGQVKIPLEAARAEAPAWRAVSAGVELQVGVTVRDEMPDGTDPQTIDRWRPKLVKHFARVASSSPLIASFACSVDEGKSRCAGRLLVTSSALCFYARRLVGAYVKREVMADKVVRVDPSVRPGHSDILVSTAPGGPGTSGDVVFSSIKHRPDFLRVLNAVVSYWRPKPAPASAAPQPAGPAGLAMPSVAPALVTVTAPATVAPETGGRRLTMGGVSPRSSMLSVAPDEMSMAPSEDLLSVGETEDVSEGLPDVVLENKGDKADKAEKADKAPAQLLAKSQGEQKTSATADAKKMHRRTVSFDTQGSQMAQDLRQGNGSMNASLKDSCPSGNERQDSCDSSTASCDSQPAIVQEFPWQVVAFPEVAAVARVVVPHQKAPSSSNPPGVIVRNSSSGSLEPPPDLSELRKMKKKKTLGIPFLTRKSTSSSERKLRRMSMPVPHQSPEVSRASPQRAAPLEGPASSLGASGPQEKIVAEFQCAYEDGTLRPGTLTVTEMNAHFFAEQAAGSAEGVLQPAQAPLVSFALSSIVNATATRTGLVCLVEVELDSGAIVTFASDNPEAMAELILQQSEVAAKLESAPKMHGPAVPIAAQSTAVPMPQPHQSDSSAGSLRYSDVEAKLTAIKDTVQREQAATLKDASSVFSMFPPPDEGPSVATVPEGPARQASEEHEKAMAQVQAFVKRADKETQEISESLLPVIGTRPFEPREDDDDDAPIPLGAEQDMVSPESALLPAPGGHSQPPALEASDNDEDMLDARDKDSELFTPREAADTGATSALAQKPQGSVSAGTSSDIMRISLEKYTLRVPLPTWVVRCVAVTVSVIDSLWGSLCTWVRSRQQKQDHAKTL
eukprot:m51a1_g4590 hypothetical protein (953) ;mRNA; r:187732-190985